MALFNSHYAPTKRCLHELITNNDKVFKAYCLPKSSPAAERGVDVNIRVKGQCPWGTGFADVDDMTVNFGISLPDYFFFML